MGKHQKTIIFLSLCAFFPSFAHRAAALDKASIDCLSCHDGALAPDSTVVTVCSEPDCDHPLGVDYRLLAVMNHGLKPAGLLDPQIKLVNNATIGCTTCHVPYKQSNHVTLSTLRGLFPDPDPMLSVDNSGSGLCLGCHDK